MASDVSSAEITEEFPQICGVPTPLLKCGQLNEQSTSLAIIIPGNPGVPDYYRDFMRHLHAASGATSLPVWCVGHAGHGRLPSHLPAPNADGDVYSLSGQARHKLTFLRSLPRSLNQVFLIGHSIGCLLLLKILDHLPKSHRCLMLFPTIERLAVSPSGQLTTPITRYLRWVVRPVVFLTSHLVPLSAQRLFFNWYFHGKSSSEAAVEASVKLMHGDSASLVAELGNEEMQEIIEPDNTTIARHQHRLTWYYGVNDHWCPTRYYEDMRVRFPRMDVRLCALKSEHAFVLGTSKDMATVTWDILQEVTEQRQRSIKRHSTHYLHTC